MELPLSYFNALKPGTMKWSIKARVLRIWRTDSVLISGQTNQIELILLDGEGMKIQASIPTHCLGMFAGLLHEDLIYVISFFHVIRNVSSCISVFNENRISFHKKTEVTFSNCNVIQKYGLSLLTSNEVLSSRAAHRYFVDVVGMLTSLHYEVDKDAKGDFKTVVKFQLTDSRGKFDCELRDECVAEFKTLFNNCYEGLPVVMLQFARVKMDKGFVHVESCPRVTRVLMDPTNAEFFTFRDRLQNQNPSCFVRSISVAKKAKKQDNLFNQMYPVKTLLELINSPTDGFFVTFGKIVQVDNPIGWYYPLCDCERILTKFNSSFYCEECYRTSFNVTPRRRVEVVVSDCSGNALFNVFEDVVYVVGGNSSQMGFGKFKCRSGFESYVNKEFLFLICKKPRLHYLAPDRFEVVEMTRDPRLLLSFHSQGNSFTPTKLIFKPIFTEFEEHGVDEAGLSRLDAFGRITPASAIADIGQLYGLLPADSPVGAKRNLSLELGGSSFKRTRGI